MIFETKIKIRFRDGDPAGILFFGNVLGLSHDIFEEFLSQLEIPWKLWFQAPDWACPIRHSEVDYQSPFFPGEVINVQAKVAQLRENSFTMHYEFKSLHGKTCALVKIVHVFVNPKSMGKISIPPLFRKKLEAYHTEQTSV